MHPLTSNTRSHRNLTETFDDTGSSSGVYLNANVPFYDIYSENVRCGRGAAISGPGVETLAVDAGDELAFFSTLNGKEYSAFHHGPAQAYLSRSTTDIESYTGDGDFFKIGYIGALNDTAWKISDVPSVSPLFSDFTDISVWLVEIQGILTSEW